MAPILAFTADEIWENLPPDNGERPPSVHLTTFPGSAGRGDGRLRANWEQLFAFRDDVLQALEQARIAKQIGSSLEARVEIQASGSYYDLLDKMREDLRYLFIVSQVELGRADLDIDSFQVRVGRAAGLKCERCWNYSPRVGESSRYPTVCERCVSALEEIERELA